MRVIGVHLQPENVAKVSIYYGLTRTHRSPLSEHYRAEQALEDKEYRPL